MFNQDGAPLEGATVRIWSERRIIESVETDERGHYIINYTHNFRSATIAAFMDYPETLGWDYLHSVRQISKPMEWDCINFTLLRGATLRFKGQFLAVEPNMHISNYQYFVQGVNTTDLEIVDFKIVYGSLKSNVNWFISLPLGDVVVPINCNFTIYISAVFSEKGGSAYLVNKESRIYKSYSVSNSSFSCLSQGDLATVKLGRHIISSDMLRTEMLREEVSELIESAEAHGFYVTSERISLSKADSCILASNLSCNETEYDEAFTELGSAWLTLWDLKGDILRMYEEASTSAYFIVAVITLTSITMAVIIFEDNKKRTLSTGLVFTAMMIFAYFVFPGIKSVQISQLLSAAAVSFSVILLTVSVFTRSMVKKRGGEVSFPSAVNASFVLGRRNLKRRRLRSFFTFTTLMTLTMSFVALTSISTVYGLNYSRCGEAPPGVKGVLMRMPEYQTIDDPTKPGMYPEDVGFFYEVTEQAVIWLNMHDGVNELVFKSENRPRLSPLNSDGLYGVIGVQPYVDPIMSNIDHVVTIGETLREDGTCLVHESFIGTVTQIGSVYMGLTVVGAFSDDIKDVVDLDGESIVPLKQVIMAKGKYQTSLSAVRCDPDELIITTYDSAILRMYTKTSRVSILMDETANIEMACKSMALGSEYRYWNSDGELAHFAMMGDIVSGKGLPILAPWGIVVLTVIMTMLGAMHERRGEINVMSSVGLNPAHISGVFMTEALILGLIAGGIGYLVGLGLYPAMAQFAFAPDVKQKVSAVWSVASFTISLISVIVGTLFSLQSSVALTPSLRRRWDASANIKNREDHYEVSMPIHLNSATYKEFIDYMELTLRKKVTPVYGVRGSPMRGLSHVIRRQTDVGVTTFSFGYCKSDQWDITSNKLQMTEPPEGEYDVTLHTVGSYMGAQDVSLFIRKVIMQWSTEQGKGV